MGSSNRMQGSTTAAWRAAVLFARAPSVYALPIYCSFITEENVEWRRTCGARYAQVLRLLCVSKGASAVLVANVRWYNVATTPMPGVHFISQAVNNRDPYVLLKSLGALDLRITAYNRGHVVVNVARLYACVCVQKTSARRSRELLYCF